MAREEEFAELIGSLRSLPAEAWTLLDEPAADLPATASSLRIRTRRRRLPLPALAGSLAALAAFVLGFVIGGGGGNSARGGATRQVALVVIDPRVAGADATIRVAGTSIVLRARDLPAPGHGEYYEAWLMTSTRRLMALASFRPNRNGQVSVRTQLPAPLRAYRYVDVSLQSEAGGTAHSRVSVLRVPTSGLS